MATPRRTHVHPEALRQSYLAAFLTIIAYLLRRHNIRSTKTALLRESFPNPPLSELLHLHSEQSTPTLHLYAAPKPFVGADGRQQIAALRSWLNLAPRPQVTLLGEGEGYERIVTEFGLGWIRDVDTNFLGVPLLNSLLAATSTCKADVAVLLNADVHLYDDFPYALRKIRRDFPTAWLAIAARWDVISLPRDINGTEHSRRHETVRHARERGVLHTYGGVDLWAWDVAAGPLVDGEVPPFVYGRGKYDNWLTHQVIRANWRTVVDMSEAITLVHVKHDHHLVTARTGAGQFGEFWNSDARGKFELYVNSYLAASYGSYSTQMGTILHAPLKMTSCYEHDGFCIFQRIRPHACRCEYSPYVGEAQNDPYIVEDSRIIFCGLLSTNYGTEEVDGRERWSITGRVEDGDGEGAFGLPLLQEQVFKMIESRTSTKNIFLVVADYGERELVMELACSMRSAQIFSWLVIAALDDNLYRFCITRGLPVYLAEFDESGFSDHERFRELARFQIMFEALKLGKQVYSVEPALVFASSPWEYFTVELLNGVDIATLQQVPDSFTGDRDGSYMSTSFIFGRPSTKTFHLLEGVMKGLQMEIARSGRLLKKFGCGEKDEGMLGANRCQIGDGPLVHFLDPEKFLTLENLDCRDCRRGEAPIAYYSTHFGQGSNVHDALNYLKRHGLSRIEEGTNYCKYSGERK